MERLPLPDDPVLAAAAQLLEEEQVVAEIVDADWRLRYFTAAYLTVIGASVEQGRALLGTSVWSQANIDARDDWPASATRASYVAGLRFLLPRLIGEHEPPPDLAPELADALDDRARRSPAAIFGTRVDAKFGHGVVPLKILSVRLTDPGGRHAGWASLTLPALSGPLLSLLGTGDQASLERLLELLRPDRRPGAVLFVDLDGSTGLARRLTTAAYFRLVRRLTTRIDQEIVLRGGLVGKHAGDGASAFFLTEHAGGEAPAARACIEAAAAIRGHEIDVAVRSGLEPGDVRLRFGLHWGATLYVGRLLTAGRAEVTALGDEVNETARIEACAAGGRTLASKSLVERLDEAGLAAAGIDAASARFTLLADLDTATEKARRDAPSIAVTAL